jgi:Zn/Cd-binding protein ZinT
MKKHLFIILALGASIHFGNLTAQINPHENLEPINADFNEGKILNDISTTALRHFFKSFGSVSNEHWDKISGGYVVFFTKNTIKQRADYDWTGTWLSTTKYLNEYQMPVEIRDVVRSGYADYKITLAIELENKNAKTYFVNLQGKTKWKKLMIDKDQLAVLEDFNER